MDGSGRFILSDVLAELAALDGDIFFYGVGQTFEIWDVARLLALDDGAYANVQAAVQAAMRVRARKAVGE
jgi:DNA-binding transcriptional regulator/RsmH inhibitor MraZ